MMNILLMTFYKLNFQLRHLQIIAILNSTTQALDLLLIKNQRSPIIRLMMISIQLVTIYVGVMQFIHFENSYTLVLVPFFFKIISLLRLSDLIYTNDPIINASFLMQERKLYESFIILNKLKDQNFIRQIKRNQLLKKCIYQINQELQQKVRSQELLGVASKLIQNDIKNIKIQNMLLNIIQWKIKLLQNWKTNEFDEIYKFVNRMLKLKQELDDYYLAEPNGMVQSLICFFYAEILNDLLEANEMIIHSKKSADLFFVDYTTNKNMFYLTTKYENGQLQMNKISSNAPSFICNKKLQDLIPLGVREWHNKLVDEFIITGKSKFVRQLNHNYVNHGSSIDTVDFAIDLTYSDQVNFICLISPTLVKNATLIVDEKYNITSYTNQFKEIKQYKVLFSRGSSIINIFPQIQEIKQSCFLENVLLNTKKLLHQSDEQEDIRYYCNLEIILKHYQDTMIYMIVKLENIQIIYQNTGNSSKKDTISNQSSSANELSIAEERHLLLNQISRQDIPLLEQNNEIKSFKQVKSLIEKQSLNDEAIKKVFNIDTIQPQVITSRGEPEQHLLVDKIKTDSKKYSVKSLTQGGEGKEQQQKQQEAKKEELFDREDQSQVSSIRMLRNSKFYRKYDLYNKFNKHMPLKRQHQFLVMLFALCIIIQGVFIIIQLTSLNLVSFAIDINLLEIKNLFFQPLDMFLVTRWNLWTYNFQKSNGIITPEEYNSVSQFATSNLGLGFDSLNSNLKLVLNRQELQGLLQTKYIDAFSYLDTFKSEQYNMTLRTAISVLLNFQYILKMNYIYEKTVKADSPQIFYSFKNYPIMRDIMTQLNSDIMVQTIARGQDFQDEMKTLFLFQQIFLILMVLSIIYAKIYINKKLMVFLHLSQYSDNDAIQQEIYKFKELLDKLQSDNSYKFNYSLQITEKEFQFLGQKVEKVSKNSKNLRKKRISPYRFILLLIVLYSILTLNSIINFYEFSKYLIKYPETAYYKKQLADLGGDIPLMFAQREVLYGRKNYMYLDAAYFDRMWYYIMESLNNTKLFTSQDPDFEQMLVTNSFNDFYAQIQLSDLCEYLPGDIKIRAATLCPTIMNQNMRHGLKAMLIYIQNLIETDVAINNFTYRAVPTQNELEGAFMISEVINVMNSNFYNDLIQVTTELVDQQEVFNICYLFILFVVFLIIITEVKNKIYENSRIIIHFVYVIPSQTIFTDDTFERTLRTLINF
ncbi:unnamed protein product (macronuclear) [Paramecium tetraurelia]|uniref:Transmembrane protein n=1 Tax=Paramecium tetraurelia TaxID=5888 RepID=A0ECS3_PARTE|nr:uncharacterized protein GSPATT00003959001 [Paramecium tetraurelia]CAK93090.1 unnamed protein product [Paramecium tetraurelia]|eukprot:XP_001460487.1 hypothetical protein (macronuclear) [Paramecium tetraurelia strain d4-2]